MSSESSDYLSISFVEDEDVSSDAPEDILTDVERKRVLPFAVSPVYHTAILKAKLLTSGQDVKTVYDVAFDVQEIDHKFEPGDTIGILPCNDEDEVEQILAHLNLLPVATKLYHLSILKETSKKKPMIPLHIPVSGTLRELLTKCLDIRSPAKKLFLRSLIRYTTQQEELEYLQLLCSPKGSVEYNKFISNNRTLLSLLEAFPSCRPPIERLLENLPPLQPRPYSISSSPLMRTKHKELHITFAVINTDWGVKGVCSGWLEKIIKEFDPELALEGHARVAYYFRKINNFRLPVNSSTPLIMIGPGTGIAPFIGFLQHRQLQTEEHGVEFGTSWLFYGCRYSDRDFLYKSEIEGFVQNGTLTKLFTCFSRETSTKVYIQDVIRHQDKDFTDKIVRENAVVYICGDAKNMIKDVRRTIVSCLEQFEGFSSDDAEKFVKNLEQTNRYIQDVWI